MLQAPLHKESSGCFRRDSIAAFKTDLLSYKAPPAQSAPFMQLQCSLFVVGAEVSSEPSQPTCKTQLLNLLLHRCLKHLAYGRLGRRHLCGDNGKLGTYDEPTATTPVAA